MDEGERAYLKGQFLIAMPSMADPNFSKTVTCISEHTSEGAIGLVINRIHTLISAEDIFKELDLDYLPRAANIPIHVGGPVHMGEIFILHGSPFDWQGCLPITRTLAMSNTLDILKSIAAGKGPEFFMICLGCAGWAPEQLESELMQNAWLTTPVSDDIVFSVSIEEKWEAAVRKMGISPELLSDTAGHA